MPVEGKGSPKTGPRMAIGAQATPRPPEEFLKNNSSSSLKASFRDFRPKMACQGYFSSFFLIISWVQYQKVGPVTKLDVTNQKLPGCCCTQWFDSLCFPSPSPPLCSAILPVYSGLFRQKRLHTTDLFIAINQQQHRPRKKGPVPGPSNNPAATNLPANDGWWLARKAARGWNTPGMDLSWEICTTQENKRAKHVLS